MPGTGLAREFPAFLRFLWLRILPSMVPLLRMLVDANTHTTRESGAALGKLAVDERYAGVSGRYFEGVRKIRSSDVSYDVGKQEELWAWTVEHVADGQEELEAFRSL